MLTITYPVPRQEDIGRDDVDLRFVLDMAGELSQMRNVAEAASDGRLPATVGRRCRLDEGAAAGADFVRLHTSGKLVVVHDHGQMRQLSAFLTHDRRQLGI